MFKHLIDKLTAPVEQESTSPAEMRQASVQLLLEVARSDTSIDEVERDTITKAILSKTGFTPEQIQSSLSESEEALDRSISFHEHVRLVNEQFDQSQKIQLIEQMWQVAYADSHLDPHEEAFIRQIADLIYLRHREFMQAKHRVIEAGNH